VVIEGCGCGDVREWGGWGGVTGLSSLSGERDKCSHWGEGAGVRKMAVGCHGVGGVSW
jgi:hypothetical protein